MLTATCHCGAIQISFPMRPPRSPTAIAQFAGGWALCGRITTWARSPLQATLRVVRCGHCGCTTHWEPLGTDKHSKLGVNIRNFEPSVVGNVRIRLLDGAKT